MTDNTDSIFTKIIKGEIPCHKVYEDDYAYAFMDIHPAQPGHVVVASKTQVATFLDLTDEQADGLWRAVRNVAKQMKTVFPNKKIAVVFEGLDVAHVHANVYPFTNHDEFIAAPVDAEPNHAELERLAQQIRSDK